MEESEEFKWAIKIVIKRQMRDLIEQLRENGEEIAIISADVKGGSCSHFGSPKGDWFMSEQRHLSSNFLNFCRSKEKKKHGLGFTQRSSPNVQVFTNSILQPARADLNSTGIKHTDSSKTVLNVSVPTDLTHGLTDEELAGVVGQLVIANLTGRLDAGNSPGKTSTFGNKDSVTRTRSGRAVSSSFQIVLNSMKKSPSKDITDVKSDIVSYPTELSHEDLKRFEVCTVSGTTVDLQSVSISTLQMEVLSEPVIQALDDSNMTNKFYNTGMQVKIVVSRDSVGDTVEILETELPTYNALYSPSGNYGDIDLDVSDTEDIVEDTDDDPDFDLPKSHKAKHLSIKQETKPTEVTSGLEKALSLGVEKPKKRINKNLKTAVCPQCGITLVGEHNLKHHINRVHLKIRNHKCSICSKGFWAASGLEVHMISVHTKKCESCEQYVVESVPWVEGMSRTTPREVACVCGAYLTLISRVGVKSAKKITYDEIGNENGPVPKRRMKPRQKYACGVCARLFANKRDCERHSKTHSPTKDFTCEVCGSGFKDRQFLCRHMFSEHGIYTNKCEMCGKNFGSAPALKVHIGKTHPKILNSSVLEQAEAVTQIELSSENNETLTAGQLILCAESVENDIH